MRLISYEKDGGAGVGVMIDDTNFVSLPAAAPNLPTTMMGLLNHEGGLAAAQAAAVGKDAHLSLSEVTLLPVVPDTPVIWAAGVNYLDHAEETGRGTQEKPMLFIRTNHGLIADGDAFIKPDISDMIDYEGELAVIIGKAGRHISQADALSHLAGYSIFNDGSVRDWQRHTIQFCPGKNFEGTGPFGPWMVTPDEFGDPYAQQLTTRLNGMEVQNTSISKMDHKIERLIEYISTIHTLRPGDVIITGTPGGVGSRREPPLWMKDGDTIEVEITGIGTLTNPVKNEGSS
ncbi:MAG: hypothetical protein CBD27_10830 [Rhodospirillaceae bacterium TMED167]|nr:5-carboxymethyl-2-hydroxymuconate isomerase [Rhodospirillaceae bacterium]MDG2034722.1 fumarylacetoacetate hydrolase family protein [Rhodospirillales bacterium]OUW24795.1 MAG: hypothetical protein CBD27_10830 [Rhodospirillaceae bacterium TMED167]